MRSPASAVSLVMVSRLNLPKTNVPSSWTGPTIPRSSPHVVQTSYRLSIEFAIPCDMRQAELTSPRYLKRSHPMSSQSRTFNQRLSQHDPNMSLWTSLAVMFRLCNQWDLTSSPSLDLSQLLSMTHSPSVILSSMSPFSETDYRIWWWNSLQLGHAITGISRLPSNGISARSS
jgi:hypothetical protein